MGYVRSTSPTLPWSTFPRKSGQPLTANEDLRGPRTEVESMYRRRRRPEREIALRSDSLLDLVANVVRIIIRLLLVAWVGARTYTGMVDLPPKREPKRLSLPDEPTLGTERERKTLEQVRL